MVVKIIQNGKEKFHLSWPTLLSAVIAQIYQRRRILCSYISGI